MQEGEDPKHLKIAATCKHAFGYSLEGPPPGVPGIDRHHFNAQIEAQDAADTYFPPFKRCIESGKVSQLMCSYNSVNGTPSCVSPTLLTDLVRDQWGFNGTWVSDCGALSDVYQSHKYLKNASVTAAAALDAGLDLNCGSVISKENVQTALAKGEVTPERLRLSLRLILIFT